MTGRWVFTPTGFLDLLLSLFLLPVICLYLLLLALGRLCGRSSCDPDALYAMFIVPAVLHELEEKGVTWMIETRDENGFFARVFTIHPFAPSDRVIELAPRHTVMEFRSEFHGFGRRLAFSRGLVATTQLIKRLVQLIRREPIAMIRAQDPYVSGVLGLVLAGIGGIPCCVSIHADYDQRHMLDPKKGAPVLFGSRRAAKLMESIVLARACMVLPIRESIGAKAIASGAASDAVHVIPHGIDLEVFRRRPAAEFAAKWKGGARHLAVFAGRLSRENYVHDIIDIAARIATLRRDILFLLVGDGHEARDLKDSIGKKELADIVSLPGFLPWETVAQLRMAADVNLCLMGGFSLIEAAASGKPVIAYDVEWHDELIRNDETGFLIPEGDVAAATEAILSALDRPEHAGKLGANARNVAFERHSLAAASRQKVQCYQALLGRG